MTRLDELFEAERAATVATTAAGNTPASELIYYRARLARIEEEVRCGLIQDLGKHIAHTKSMIEHCETRLQKEGKR